MKSGRLLTSIVALSALLALLLAASATANRPINTDGVTIQQQGSQLIGGNGGWLSYSGPVEKYVFRFSRDGTTLKGPDSMPVITQYPNVPANTYPDVSDANVYNLTPADAGRQVCLEVWAGTHSVQGGADPYDVWEWGHEDNAGIPARVCLTVSGTPTTGPTPPTGPPAQSPLAPAATAAPSVGGLAMVSETLTASRGTWSGSQPMTLALQWQRCDAEGENCADLGLSGDTYTVLPVDVGKRIRIRVAASNGSGARTAVSDPTEVVTELRPTDDRPTLAASRVTAPHRLVIDRATAAPKRVVAKKPLVITLRISDDRGFRIEGAVVTGVALPGTAFLAAVAATSNANGLVRLTFRPGRKLTTSVKKVTLVLNARRPGDRTSSPRAGTLRLTVPVAIR